MTMLKNTNKTKDTGTNFDLKIDSLIEKKNYFNEVQNLCLSTCCQISTKKRHVNQIRQ